MGNPGSLTDVFVEVPAAGTLSGARLTVIVEVKRSCNSEVKHALQTQLVDRYLEEGTNFGVYVVAFFDSEAFEMRPSDNLNGRVLKQLEATSNPRRLPYRQTGDPLNRMF